MLEHEQEKLNGFANRTHVGKRSKGTNVVISDNILETERLNKAKFFLLKYI